MNLEFTRAGDRMAFLFGCAAFGNEFDAQRLSPPLKIIDGIH